MRMRTKIAFGFGMLLAVLAVTALADRWLTPTEPRLRVGMSTQEASDALRDDYDIANGNGSDYLVEFPVERGDFVSVHWAGPTRSERGEDFVLVWFSAENKVKGWRVHYQQRPSLVDRVKKSVGW